LFELKNYRPIFNVSFCFEGIGKGYNKTSPWPYFFPAFVKWSTICKQTISLNWDGSS